MSNSSEEFEREVFSRKRDQELAEQRFKLALFRFNYIQPTEGGTMQETTAQDPQVPPDVPNDATEEISSPGDTVPEIEDRDGDEGPITVAAGVPGRKEHWVKRALAGLPEELKKFVFIDVRNTGDTTLGVRLQYDVVSKVGIAGMQVGELTWLPLLMIEYLNGKYPCQENIDALGGLRIALEADRRRTANRVGRKVEGQEVA